MGEAVQFRCPGSTNLLTYLDLWQTVEFSPFFLPASCTYQHARVGIPSPLGTLTEQLFHHTTNPGSQAHRVINTNWTCEGFGPFPISGSITFNAEEYLMTECEAILNRPTAGRVTKIGTAFLTSDLGPTFELRWVSR